ncbi:MAG TPA: alpha/beta fold hydrolase, partial [Erythrobacter sp.]
LNLDGPRARRHNARLIGNGADVVVLSHGLGNDQRAWDAIIERMPEQVAALVFDLPGAGPLLPSDFDPEDYSSVADYADDLLGLLDEIGIARCTYVGHSVSGMIGVLASIEEPGRFAQLILLNASPRYLNAEGYVGGFDQTELDGLFAAMSANYQAWVAGFAPAAVGVAVPQAIIDFSAGLLAMRPDVTARIARMIFTSDLRHVLPLVSVPTLLIHAREDIAVPAEVGRYLHAHIPGSRLAWIDTAGHLPHLSAPDEVAAILNADLAR